MGKDCGNIKLIGSQVYQAPYVCPTTQRFWNQLFWLSLITWVWKRIKFKDFPSMLMHFRFFPWPSTEFFETSFLHRSFLSTLLILTPEFSYKEFPLLLRWQVFHQRINARSTIRFESGRKYRAGISLWSLPTIIKNWTISIKYDIHFEW